MKKVLATWLNYVLSARQLSRRLPKGSFLLFLFSCQIWAFLVSFINIHLYKQAECETRIASRGYTFSIYVRLVYL